MNKDKNKVLYVNSTFTKELTTTLGEQDSIYIEGYASTNDMDRSGDVVPSSVWAAGIQNFLKNPIILAQHDHSNPIGRMVEHKVTPIGLYVKARISAATEVYNLIKDEVLTAFSIGFRVIDAEYNATTELFVVKELELLEISVVSVPCNQNTLFSLSKAFNDADDYISFKSQFAPESESAKGLESSKEAESTIQKEWKMNPEEIKQMVADAAKQAVEQTTKAFADQAAAQAQAQATKAAQEAEIDARVKSAVAAAVNATAPAVAAPTVITTVDTGAERLMADIEKKFADQAASTKSVLDGLQSALADKAAEITAMQKSKMSFADKSGTDPVSITEKTNAVMLASVLGKSITDTKYGRELVEKAGAHIPGSTGAPWELEVSFTMEEALRRKLVVAPLFRQIAMKTNVLSIPVNPEVGSATWVTAFNPTNATTLNTTSGGTGVTHKLNEVTLNSYKIATKEFVGYEEEEDSLLILMPMIRDAMVRRCAKAIDSALLVGDGSTVPISGLGNRAGASAAAQQNAVATIVTLGKLRALRASLGNYGLDPADVAYIVNNETYYDLMESTDFMTMEKVGPLATVLTGQVGFISGSPVITSGEMPVRPASGSVATTAGVSGLTNLAAIAVYLPNFLMGSQRGLRMDTQDLAAEQARVLVASMRVGMTQISASVGVSALRYIG